VSEHTPKWDGWPTNVGPPLPVETDGVHYVITTDLGGYRLWQAAPALLGALEAVFAAGDYPECSDINHAPCPPDEHCVWCQAREAIRMCDVSTSAEAKGD
jgi:hypothetical protein